MGNTTKSAQRRHWEAREVRNISLWCDHKCTKFTCANWCDHKCAKFTCGSLRHKPADICLFMACIDFRQPAWLRVHRPRWTDSSSGESCAREDLKQCEPIILLEPTPQKSTKSETVLRKAWVKRCGRAASRARRFPRSRHDHCALALEEFYIPTYCFYLLYPLLHWPSIILHHRFSLRRLPCSKATCLRAL